MSRHHTAWLLGAALAGGLLLRALGIGWGLPDRLYPGEPPFHPDEYVPFVQAARLYGEPTGTTFIWGGSFYMRLTWLARQAVGTFAPASEFAATLLALRWLNVALALGSAGLVFWIARRLDGPAAALGAAALLMVFPGPVLDAHYARPDVLVGTLATAALACAVQGARSGRLRCWLLGGLCAGTATAAVLSGLIGLGPLAVAGLERGVRDRRPGRLRRLLAAGVASAAGFALGWVLGNTEALLHPDAFRAGLGIALGSHQGGAWAFPARLLGYVPLYSYGALAALAAYAGVAVLWARAARGVPGAASVAGHLLLGYLLLGRVGFDMMRHLEFLAPASALSAALALCAGARALARSRRAPGGLRGREGSAQALALLVPVALGLQLSLGYVWPLQTEEDPRYRIGRWLVANAPPGSRVGVTASFYGDQTYQPRLPPPHALRGEILMLRKNFDASGYLDRELDYVATSEYARRRARGDSAPAFFRELFAGARYERVATAGPGRGPWLCLACRLADRRPADLEYVRSTFYVFRRRSG